METGPLSGSQPLSRNWVFFLEEPSAEDFLRGFLAKRTPADVTLHFQVFEGKQDLEKQLARRIRYWRLPNSQFLVMRDQDSGDCIQIKQRLRALCDEASRPEAVIRIACRELETFFVGDWEAIAAAFDKPALGAHARSAKFRAPDQLGSPSEELKRVLPFYGKRDGARRISRVMVPERNRSTSFQFLFKALCNF